ncbi:PAP2 superfamily protein [Motilibacter peucedani]|uniref:PAP2 superfamily protein n=1 Tax=Motilibacter peucedani TaxID=598650 RepID=A0A420XTI6_9ACTN|nr:phosphatase PAP2 family protein [Motilibacter peucedani]RKS80146.1 PAP2 superfamily protein [Motilibacter peucedani]
MPHLSFGWHTALEIALVLITLSLVLMLPRTRWARFASLALRESALMVTLYGLWGVVGAYTLTDRAAAISRGQSIWKWERRLHVPGEDWLQSYLLPHPHLTQVANAYYIYGHFNVLIAMLAWVWLRHRDAYPRLRLTIIVFTLMATAVQVVPVAPPRLLPGHLVVDTPTLFGQSVYDAGGLGAISQLAAMPSIHVGWSVLFAVTFIRLGRTWRRYLSVLHPLTMATVVVVTGNHYWADGAVSVVLLLLTFALLAGWDALRHRVRRGAGTAHRPDERTPVAVA